MSKENQLLREALQRYVSFAATRRAWLGELSEEMEAVDAFARDALSHHAQPAEGGEVLGLSCGEACKLVEQLCTNLNEYHCAKHQDYRDLFNTRATECEGKLKDLLRALYTAPPASHVPEADFGNNQPASQEQADDTRRCIDARNKLNAAIHGDGAVIDDLETVVHQACLIIKRHRASQEQAQQPSRSLNETS